MRFSDRLIEEVRQRNDLVEVVSLYVPLKRAGRNYKARCPFHAEKTPSFIVSPDKQVYHCFGCGAGGNVFSFLMQHERMAFPETLAFLAQRAGVALPRESGGRSEEYESLYAANAYAARFFQRTLRGTEGRAARDYLRQRGIQGETLEAFALGYAPPSWDGLLRSALADRPPPVVLERAGLVVPREGKEGWYDRFRNRLMFPITSLSGKIVGFGGRRLDEKDEPKYLNSPESTIYQKGRLLYGLYQTKGAIQDAGSAVVVEGYLDFLSPYQAGVKNIVATLGTALTSEQAQLLARFTSSAILFYDNDAAGQTAVQRAFEPLLEAEMDIHVATPPAGMDPDDLARKAGQEGLERAFQEQRDVVDYELNRWAKASGLASPSGRAKAVNAVLERLAKIKDEVRQRLYLQKLAQRVGLSEGVLVRSLEKKPRRGRSEALPEARADRATALEREILRLLTKQPERRTALRERLGEAPFRDPLSVEIFAGLSAEHSPSTPADWLSVLPSEASRRLVASWAFRDKELEEERLFEKCLEDLGALRRRERSRELLQALTEAERTSNKTVAEALTSEYQGLLRRNEKA